jgi:hypothetical protein
LWSPLSRTQKSRIAEKSLVVFRKTNASRARKRLLYRKKTLPSCATRRRYCQPACTEVPYDFSPFPSFRNRTSGNGKCWRTFNDRERNASLGKAARRRKNKNAPYVSMRRAFAIGKD